jgi:VCBS repeat-containing protein
VATFNGNNSANTIIGTNGDDTINGNGGNDHLDGKGGNDTINGGTGNDEIYGGTGNDTIHGNADQDEIHGGDNNDTIFGDDGNDQLFGDSGVDVISGGNGDDEIDGGTGDDILHGNADNDAISGGDGNDTITGDDGNDVLDGGNNNDNVSGGSGNDIISGGDGNDTLTGGGGYDLIYGGNGTDTAVYSGSILDYDFYNLGFLLGIVHSRGTMADGADLLLSIEKLQFSDVTIDLTHNNAPIAQDDAAATNEDAGTYSSGSASVLDNDFDFEGDTLTVAPGSFSGTFGTLTLNANGTYSYVLNANAQTLAQGQTGQDIFTYTVSDGSLTDTATLTITITGLNDAPVANNDSASGTENQILTINVLVNDTDVDDGHVLTVVSASAPVNKGTASVVGNQVQFNPGTDFDHLAQGATETVVLNYTITDEHGATSSATINVLVTGTNDGPVAVADTASGTENQILTIDVLVNDTDVDDGHTLTVVSASAPAGQGSASVVGNQVQFNPGTDFDHLAQGATQVVTVNYSIQDEHGAASSSTITITVTGTNDAPVAVADTASGTENQVLTIDVLVNDTDADDGHVLSVTAASAPAGQGTAAVVGNQVQFDPGTDFDHLAVGETATVTVNYSIQDEHGASSSSTVTITVTGTNDAPTINAGGTDASGSVTELPNNDPGENVFVHQDSGAVAFNDIDTSDVHSATATPQGGSYLGTFTLDPVNQAGDNVTWHFDVSDAALDSLDAGDTLTQIYTIEIDDGHGGTATQDVTITINGAADANGPPWYIDNSAVGSANVGSQSDPFTSIAAFNAAQGSVGGPATGETVYLLAGTGTYTEADGINLLDGQVLIGVPSGAVRPTIVATSGDGINVAQGNDVSHIDIGNTSGAGIADSGGSVGTLIVSDVGKSGSGQIADLDQGGTLNVTLNNASSTGSTGGAVDLAGVGGSFSVSGATTITGAQAGGGVDITGSSLTFTLAGGGTISTGATTAVNFAGNTGTLALGGGLDIATTSGAGLNASGGGSVTFTGAGNSVTSTTGTAVTISGTTIGAGGVTLESVSSAGAASGIVLANTGGGAFTVTGTGVAGSGGAILTSTGAGISLTNTGPVSLTDFAVSNGGDDGIRGAGVNGLSLLRTTVSSNGNAAGEHGMDLTNLTGIVGIASSFFTGSAADNIHIVNASGTLDLTMTGSTVGNSLGALANDGLFIQANGTSLVRASVTNSTFVNNRGDHFQFTTDLAATSTSHITFNNNILTSTPGSGVVGGGITIGTAGAADLRFDIENNNIQGAFATAIGTGMTASTAAGEVHGTISGNTIGTAAVANSGSASGDGINAQLSGNGTMTVRIENNDVHQWNSFGIFVVDRDGAGRLNATIEDNVIAQPGGFAIQSMRIQAGAAAGDSGQIWLEMNDNVSNTPIAADIRLWSRFDADILMPGYSGAANGTAAVDAFETGKNPLAGDIVVLFAANAGSGFFDTPGSAPVPLPLSPDIPFV